MPHRQPCHSWGNFAACRGVPRPGVFPEALASQQARGLDPERSQFYQLGQMEWMPCLPVSSGVFPCAQVRALKDPQGRSVKSVGPGAPAEISGLRGVPMAGDELTVLRRCCPVCVYLSATGCRGALRVGVSSKPLDWACTCQLKLQACDLWLPMEEACDLWLPMEEIIASTPVPHARAHMPSSASC